MSTQMKICTACQTMKPLCDYYDHKEGKHGKNSRCIICCLANRPSARSVARASGAWACAQCKIVKPAAEYYASNKALCKDCYKRREYARREAVPGSHAKAARESYTRHADEINARRRAAWPHWTPEQRAAHNEANKQWALANPDKIRASRRRAYENNKAYYKEQNRVWAANNRDKKRIHEFNRRALENNANGIADIKQTQARIDYYGGVCWVPGCGLPYEDVDHFVPLRQGGTNWPANLRPICKSHNSAKGAKHPIHFLRSLAKKAA